MLRYGEGLRPLAKLVTYLCPLVNLTGNLTKDCVAFCKSELFPCQPWKMKWPKSIFNYQSYQLRNILYTVGTNKGFSLTFSISYKIAFNGEHRFKFFNFRNQYKQATTISWNPGLKPKQALFTQDPQASADSCTNSEFCSSKLLSWDIHAHRLITHLELPEPLLHDFIFSNWNLRHGEFSFWLLHPHKYSVHCLLVACRRQTVKNYIQWGKKGKEIKKGRKEGNKTIFLLHYLVCWQKTLDKRASLIEAYGCLARDCNRSSVYQNYKKNNFGNKSILKNKHTHSNVWDISAIL